MPFPVAFVALGVLGIAAGGATLWAQQQERKKKRANLAAALTLLDDQEREAAQALEREWARRMAHDSMQAHPVPEIEEELPTFDDKENEGVKFHDPVKTKGNRQTQSRTLQARQHVEPLKSHRSDNGEQTADEVSPTTFESLYDTVWCGGKTHRSGR